MNSKQAKKFAAEIDDKLLELDLHKCNLNEIAEKVDQFLYQCVKNKYSSAKVITGIGKGVIKEKILTYLRDLPLVQDIIVRDGEIIVIF